MSPSRHVPSFFPSLPPSAVPGKRLFVALWPPPPLQRELAALAALAAQIGGGRGAAVPAANMHLTLAFLGACSNEREACCRAALRELVFDAFTLRIDTLGWWRKPRVVWAGPGETPAALPALVREIGERLRPCGGPRAADAAETRSEAEPPEPSFAAHITLLRKHPGPVPAWDGRGALLWRADTVALVESLRVGGAVHYRPLLRIGARTARETRTRE